MRIAQCARVVQKFLYYYHNLLRCYAWSSYPPIIKDQKHDRFNQSQTDTNHDGLYGAYLIASLVKRLIRGTFQGHFELKYFKNYFDVFRFNRRKCKFVGKKLMRIVQQVMQSAKIKCEEIEWDLNPISYNFALAMAVA